jgi:two-component sensor histidine kinase
MSSVRFIFILFVCFSIQYNFCQTNTDKKIDNYLARYQYDSAYVLIQKNYKKTKNNTEKKAAYNIKYAKVLKSLSRPDSCFYFLEKAEDFYKIKKDESKLFYILTFKAEIARSLVKRNIAIKYIHEAEKLLPKNKNLDYKYYYFNRRIALLAEYYNNIPDSVVKIKQIGNLILGNQSEVKDKSLICYTLNEIGYLDFHKNPKNARNYFLRAFQVAEKYNAKIAFIDIAINLGRYYQQKESNFPKAIYYYQKGIKKAKEINNLWQMQQCYNELKNTSSLSYNYKNSMHYGDSLNGVNNLLSEYTNNKKYELLENNFIIQTKEKELLTSKKNQLLLLIILIMLLTGLATLWFYNNKINKSKKNLERLNRENEFLVSETNHRINNNLQLISLLINETVRKNKNKENNDLIRLQSKIESIAFLHRELYDSKDKKRINLQLYFHKIEESFTTISQAEQIDLKFNIDGITCDSEHAMYLGLLVIELVMNSIKYAFEENQIKKIMVEIIKIHNKIEFNYSDNGKKNKDKSINPVLVKQLCQQIGVHPQIIIENGFHISFIKSIENA